MKHDIDNIMNGLFENLEIRRQKTQVSHFPTDHSKVASKLVFNFHSDSQHGWLAVKLTLIRELGLEDKISPYSYMKGKTAYLEEDCDAGLFIDAFKNKFGSEPIIKDLEPRDYSPIRSMKRFNLK